MMKAADLILHPIKASLHYLHQNWGLFLVDLGVLVDLDSTHKYITEIHWSIHIVYVQFFTHNYDLLTSNLIGSPGCPFSPF